jgi:murein DD-endopeptidase MepM/ murein hydrolase activator NlpD
MHNETAFMGQGMQTTSDSFFFSLLAGLLLAALIGTGCAAAQRPYAPAPDQPRGTAAPEAVVSHPAGGQTGRLFDSGVRVYEPSAVQRMLAGAGRDAAQEQPERGFSLQVPDRVWAGEPFFVSFGASGLQKLHIAWNGKGLSLAPDRDGAACGALLAVSLTEKAVSLPLVMRARWADGREETFTADLPVEKRDYPVQKLRVQQKYVTPPREVLERIKREQAELRAVVTKISPQRFWTLPMQRPVPGEVTSEYGLRRVFNGQERNPHKGIDFDAEEGDPVAALDRGVVVLTAEHYYSGKLVAVDHGLGVFSLYLHLSAFDVAVGQRVERGQTVGRIGSTGRVTGPHLHLSFAVLGDMVNAAPCIGMQ